MKYEVRPLSHPFVERLIGTIRRECLDRTPFWTAADLEATLFDFQRYFNFNGHRTHQGLGGLTPEPRTGDDSARANVSTYRWQPHGRGLYQTPIAVYDAGSRASPYLASGRPIAHHAHPCP